MTAMESDSESQDSDDGRRFRFEATRKDSVAPVNTADRTRAPKRNKSSQHDKGYRDRKERSKYESSSKTTDDKDLRHSAKHSKHDSRNSRQEDNKNSHRESRSGFVTNDRGGSNGNRNSNGGDARERSRGGDLKRQSDRDRSIHRAQHSREHSYERNHHDERATSDKHRGSRYHERHKHRSRDRSRDRSHQSSRVKLDDHRSRDDHGRHDSSRKRSSKEKRLQNPRDYSSPKNVERERSHSETRSSENAKKDSSIEAQDCKDLDLSQFDVLSETDENMSDGRDSEDRTSSPHLRNVKTRDFEISSESRATKRKSDDEADKRKREELKVKRRSCDPASSSSNNNPSAVSDSLHDAASHATFLVTRETRTDSEREKSEYREEERLLVRDSNFECSSSGKKYSRSDASSDEIQLPEKNVDQTVRTYGPLLPPEFSSNASDDNKLDSEMFLHENKINDEADGKSMNFVGPCLPSQLNDRRSVERKDVADTSTTAEGVFGPALPPHLLQRQQKNDSRDKIIGPVLPADCGIPESHEDSTACPESDDDSAIGPLPADHPALRTSHVHEQLDVRARRIRNEKYSEEIDDGNKREEWMTELPPAQAANLGLGPRKFRLRDGPDMSDRSCWTDTPAEKARKQRDSESKRQSEKKHVNEFHKKNADKSRKCEKSLLEMHQSKIAKKKKKEEKEAKQTGISTRRPFDRDIDLQVNRFDQAQKKTILVKAQLLDDRFSRGQI